MKYMLLVLVLALPACATTYKNKEDIRDLKSSLAKLQYYIAHDGCFIHYNKCMIKGTNEETCWDRHEKCVVSVYREYRSTLE